MCSGSEVGSHLRLIDFVYHSTLGFRVIKNLDLGHGAAVDADAFDGLGRLRVDLERHQLQREVFACRKAGLAIYLRILVYLVIYDSG